MRTFRSPDGTDWGVEIIAPSFSNAMLLFRHPDGRSSLRDRYNWYQWPGSESRNVTARLKPSDVLEDLTDQDVARLFRRSMPVSTQHPLPVNLAVQARESDRHADVEMVEKPAV